MADGEKYVGPIPQMGYGTWNRPGDEAYNGTLWALEAGCRHIDTAQGYQNEDEVGSALKDSGVLRKDIWITTKVAPENYGPGEVMRSSKESLEKLGLDQVDLLLLHWPSPHNQYPLESYISQFAEVYDAGMAKYIGISNFTIPLLTEALELLGDRRILTNQVEIHVYMQNRPIVDHCRGIGISTTAYCPLARGALIGDPVLTEIGKAHGATDAQIALAFLMAEGHIVIPSSGKKDRIATNFEARRIELGDEEVQRIRSLERGQRLVNGAWTPEWDV
jgi:2,5-diketo-D-gluconate reductase B